MDNYRSIRCEWHYFSAKLWINPLISGCFCRISSFSHWSYPQSAFPMLPNFQLKSAYPGGYIHLDSALCREGPNPFQQSFLCPPVDSEVYPHIADPITIIFHRQRSSRNCIRLFHVKRRRFSTWHLQSAISYIQSFLFGDHSTNWVCFPTLSFPFSESFFIIQPVFVNPTFLMLLSVAFVCILLVSHETFYHEASVTDLNRNRIVFILVYISAVVGQQYISLSTVLFHVKLQLSTLYFFVFAYFAV